MQPKSIAGTPVVPNVVLMADESKVSLIITYITIIHTYYYHY